MEAFSIPHHCSGYLNWFKCIFNHYLQTTAQNYFLNYRFFLSIWDHSLHYLWQTLVVADQWSNESMRLILISVYILSTIHKMVFRGSYGCKLISTGYHCKYCGVTAVQGHVVVFPIPDSYNLSLCQLFKMVNWLIEHNACCKNPC